MSFVGMSRSDGTQLTELIHLRQSIVDILTTPIGSRVMRRDYGSRIYELLDAPLNSSTLMSLFAATADALGRWEPRVKIKSVSAEQGASDGHVVINLIATYLPSGDEISIEGILV